jgi:hypothetical protein
MRWDVRWNEERNVEEEPEPHRERQTQSTGGDLSDTRLSSKLDGAMLSAWTASPRISAPSSAAYLLRKESGFDFHDPIVDEWR